VITSSTSAPDLGAICRSALGRGVASAEPIGAGRNSRVFRVDLDHAAALAPASVVVKFYRRDPGDGRDRLGTEFGSLQFLWENGVHAVPRPIAVDRDRRCAIYEYIEGEAPMSGVVTSEDVQTSVDFLGTLKALRDAPGSDGMSAASEACFSLAEIVASVEGRLERLRGASASRASGASREDLNPMRQWIGETFEPLLIEVRGWCHDVADRSGVAFDRPIDRAARTLSPSDFGFHNAIRRPDGYFGWDDPAKTIVDYLLHPGMALGDGLKRRFATLVQAALADIPMLAARARIVYPLFGLKWALILLNDFLPGRFTRANDEWRHTQLGKARAIVHRVAGEYAHNPYLSGHD
jgi:hypothetical protein